MGISKKSFSGYVREFAFRELFNEMGWNNDRTKHAIIVHEKPYAINCLAEKSGFRILSCTPAGNNSNMPDKETRKKIQREITKLFQEHIIIYYDESKSSQIWQTPIRKTGFPTRTSEITVISGKDPEQLYQRAGDLFFTIDEEEKITIVDVTKRVIENFQQNNETVTKKFYEAFKKEHTSFLKFIEGIGDKAKLDWYTSLMLNRLMFCYFIQKQRFLDKNMDYLQDKLKECKAKKGKNKFYSFYRDFLLSLFHKGLGSPTHSKELMVELGKIPYLNGGLFDVHVIEKEFTNIQIDDTAFERLFDFFDQWNWHLDTRVEASGRDINPDVIGYIFEKYINDRAQMGAYYTKEDITDYISKNCIIPWLFDEVKREYPKFYTPDSQLWQIVKESGDEYIYDAVKYGIPKKDDLFGDLPIEIKKGFDDKLENKVVDGNGPWLWELRKEWNKLAPNDIALPTEIYREVIERRRRYGDILYKISNGEVHEVNDFITLNLNIRQFAQDVVEDTEDPEFIRHFYKALSGATILDPTCGSGAFLFAAMNILEPLYESCIQRMQEFVNSATKGKYKFFEETLKQVNAPEHPNLKYYIYKSIILNNLYGVDIMNEAVEIAKLRLFLKLVATVEADYHKENMGLEPLPDVDFNIRSGNTLVGYATKKQIDEIAGMFVTDAHKKKILEQCDVVARAFECYKEIQLKGGEDYKQFKTAKDELNCRLKELTADLDKVCYIDMYKGDERDICGFQKWRESHKPFHWFAEYYEIVSGNGGFDVVIGNPPYVEYSKVKSIYTIVNVASIDAGNLYAYVIENAMRISHTDTRLGMIIQLSAFCTPRMKSFQNVWFNNSKATNLSFYDDRPGKLFDGLQHIRVVICLSVIGDGKSDLVGTTNYMKFYTEFRPYLFQYLHHELNNNSIKGSSILKVNSCIEHEIIDKVWKMKHTLGDFLIEKESENFVYYGYGYGYFGKILNFKSYFKGDKVKESTGDKYIYIRNEIERDIVVGLMNSSLFYWFYVNYSDGHNFTKYVIGSIPFNIPSPEFCKKIKLHVVNLMGDLKNNSNRRTASYKATGTVIYDEFFPKYSKLYIDNVDSLFAQHYGFTQAELDFIINYDIKYRMGKELDGGEEE
jgi:hypothetical protein